MKSEVFMTLKPCPWCGALDEELIVNEGISASPFIVFWVECRKCFIDGPNGRTKIDAVRAWNRRAK